MVLLAGNGGGLIEFGNQDPIFTKTDADGRFRLRGVEPGVELVLSADGASIQPFRSQPLVVDADEIRNTPDLVPGGQVRRHMQSGRQDRRADAVFLQSIGYLPGLIDGAALMRMERFDCS